MNIAMPDKSRKSKTLPLAVIAIFLLGIVAAVVYYRMSREIHFEGEVSGVTISVSSSVSGNINRIDVKDGQMVAKGQSILGLDPAPYRKALDEANLELSRLELLVPAKNLKTADATADKDEKIEETLEERLSRRQKQEDESELTLHAAAQKEAEVSIYYNRVSMLAARGKATVQELEAAEQARDSARSAHAAAKKSFENASLARAGTSADLKQAKLIEQASTAEDQVPAQIRIKNYEQQRERARIALENLKATNITAPENGVILLTLVKQGETVAAGQPCIYFAPQNAPVSISAQVDDATAMKLKPAQLCEISITGSPDNPFSGYINAVLPKIAVGSGVDDKSAVPEAADGVRVKITLLGSKAVFDDTFPADTHHELPFLPDGAKAQITVLANAPLWTGAAGKQAADLPTEQKTTNIPGNTPAETPAKINIPDSDQTNDKSVVQQIPQDNATQQTPAADPKAVELIQVPDINATLGGAANTENENLTGEQPAVDPEAQKLIDVLQNTGGTTSPVPLQEAPEPAKELETEPARPAQNNSTDQLTAAGGQNSAAEHRILPPIAPDATKTTHPEFSTNATDKVLLPVLPPMVAPKSINGTGLPDPDNNPSIVKPEQLEKRSE